MSETSRSRVTITLGRAGQVVKRAGSLLDDEFPVVGSKRPVRERLGSNVDSSAKVDNKRLRRDGGTATSFYDGHLSKDDLRYKIMQKNRLKQSQSDQYNGGDLRNILSRPAQSSTNSTSTKKRMPEPKDDRQHYVEQTDGRQKFLETRDGRSLLPTRNASLPIPEFKVGRSADPRKQYILESREGEQSIFKAKDVRLPMPVPRSSNVVTGVDSGINSFSPWTLDRLRQRSPDESLVTYRGLKTPKKDETVERGFAVRPYDDVRNSTYMSKDSFDISRPMSTSNLTEMAPPVGQMKAMLPMSSTVPLYRRSLGQKIPYMVDHQVTVDSFLHSLGLEKFAINFKAEEVDMYSLKRMSERDLKELGLPMGPRKKILLSLQPRTRQQVG